MYLAAFVIFLYEGVHLQRFLGEELSVFQEK